MITIPPALVEREATPYVAVPRRVTMDQLDAAIPASVDQVAAWLTAHGIELSGLALIRYRVIDMAGVLQVEIGWSVDSPVDAPAPFVVDVLPAGTYGSATYRDPSEGIAGNGALIAWADDAGIGWDVEVTDDGDAFASRVEFFLTGPDEDPDPTTWLTEVAILVAG